MFITEFDTTTKQATKASQPLPCATLDDAATMLGEPARRYAAMLIYHGSPAYCVTRCPIRIDREGNSGQNVNDYHTNGSS